MIHLSRFLVVPMVALAPLALTTAPLLLGTTAAQAVQLKSSNSQLVLSTKRGTRPSAGTSFAGTGGPLPDTCNSSDPWGLCELDEFVARCDAAGSGLSTQPGGGVDCDTSGWDN